MHQPEFLQSIQVTFRTEHVEGHPREARLLKHAVMHRQGDGVVFFDR